MSNPFRKHANPMFASRGCDMDLAMAYATEVLFALSSDKAAAMTALMVVVNTAANAFDQATGPSPEKLALIELIDSRIEASAAGLQDKVDDIIKEWVANNLDIDDQISTWMSDNFDVTDYNVDAIDIDEKVTDWMNEYLESHIGEAINNMDLVVRQR
jgi:hypothetical protein